MKAALIPPKGYEFTVLDSHIHLILPLQACMSNRDYLRVYRQARERGDLLILDNGCAEGKMVDGDTLLHCARALQVDEIVAPDVMDDGPATVEATLSWLDEHRDEIRKYDIMGVLQGQGEDWCRTLDAFATRDEIETIGVPKVHVRTHYSDYRLRIVNHILRWYPGRFTIHLLGLNANFPTEIRDVDYPFQVRSMDSAQPYKLAEDNRELSGAHSWVKRRDDYFETMKVVNADLLNHNISTFRFWARRNEG